MKLDIEKAYLIEKRIDIGMKFRDARQDKGLSQAELAEQLGINVTTVDKIEKGKWNYGIDILHTFANHLGLLVDLKVND